MYLTIYRNLKECLKCTDVANPNEGNGPPAAIAAAAWRLRFCWRTAWRFRRNGRRRHARRAHAGAGRPAAHRARLDRRGAAPRLRNHQARRRENRGLVQPESRHRLSDADLSGGSGLRHRVRPKAARSSTPSPRKAAPTCKPIAMSSTPCSTAWLRSANA